MAVAAPGGQESGHSGMQGSKGEHLSVDDTLERLVEHPAFAGFGRRILPWDERDYDETLRIQEVGALLPYHSHVAPRVVVAALNRMVDAASGSETVFHDIYSPAEKRADPSREHTGLFFFRGRPGAPFAVIAPGGGFAYVASLHEGFPYAVEISDRGNNAFVLKYRAGRGGDAATEDLAAAISYIFRNADALGVASAGYSVWGSSAGARMAAAIGSHGTARFGGADLPRPSCVVMAYTGHSEVAAAEPPTFVVGGERDGIAPPTVMQRRVAALRATGTEVAFHVFPGVGHGFGLGGGTSAEGWVADAVGFWEKQMRRAPSSPSQLRQ